MEKCSGLVFNAALDLYSFTVVFETLAFCTSGKLKMFKIDKEVFIFSLTILAWRLIMFSLFFGELTC